MIDVTTEEAYEAIKIARATTKLMGRSPTLPTQAKYKKIAENLLSNYATPISHAKTKNSYYMYRAAWTWYLSDTLKKLLVRADELKESNSEQEWRIAVNAIKMTNDYLHDYQPDHSHKTLNAKTAGLWVKKKSELSAAGTVIKSYSKAKLNKKLNPHWRDTICDLAIGKNSMYATAICAMSITGCRPDELQTGVNFELHDGALQVTIMSSKTHEGKFGGPIRKFTLADDGSSAFKRVADTCRGNNGLSMIHAPAIAVSKAVKLCATQADMPQVSSYNFRHQMAADLKRCKQYAVENIAKVLGHCNDVSQTYYAAASKSSGKRDITEIVGKEVKMSNAKRLAAHKEKTQQQSQLTR